MNSEDRRIIEDFIDTFFREDLEMCIESWRGYQDDGYIKSVRDAVVGNLYGNIIQHYAREVFFRRGKIPKLEDMHELDLIIRDKLNEYKQTLDGATNF